MSLPSWELFAAQPAAYRDAVLPPAIRARVSVEAATSFGWHRWLGDGGEAVEPRPLRRLRAGRAALRGIRFHRRPRGGHRPARPDPHGMRDPMARDNPLVRLGALGQSPWYDFITRELIATGELRALISNDGLLGMTSNPTIFEKAIAGSADYDDDIRRLAAEGLWRGGDLRGARHRRRARRLRRVPDGVPEARWPGRPRLAGSVPDACARRRGHRGRGPAALGRGGSAQPDDQDPGHRRRAWRHRALHRRRDQRERHAALFGRPARSRDGGISPRGSSIGPRPGTRLGQWPRWRASS